VKRRRHAASSSCALLLLLAAAAPSASACELVLLEHRSGRELQRVPLDAAEPAVRVAFEHSVLGTPVVDRYLFKPRAVLVEERFEGSGYGLPHGAGPGERLVRDRAENRDGWRLELQRTVHPLVVRPLPAQRMRLLLPDGPLLLASLSIDAIELQARGCAANSEDAAHAASTASAAPR
jgi:hypothetical protein